jgi:hypothetical protein
LGTSSDRASRTAHTPGQFAQTLSRIDTYPKLQRVTEIILDTELESYSKQKYIRMGDAEFCGLGDSRYVLFMWERVNG